MAERARHKVNTIFYTMFHANPGKVQSDFDVSFYKDNVLQVSPSFTIAETADSGLYTFQFTPATTGYWHADIHSGGGASHDYDADLDVVNHTVDDLYDLVSGQLGLKEVTITVEDSSDVAVPGMRINVFNGSNTVFLCSGTTNTSGQVVFSLDAGSYKLRLAKYGIATTSADLTVTSDATQAVTVDVTATSVTAPTDASVCRLFADFIEMDGTVYEGLKVMVENLYLPTSNMAMVQREKTYTSNSSGHVEFDVVRGAKVRVSFLTTTFVREITVPDQASSNLLTLMGAVSDPFVVVT